MKRFLNIEISDEENIGVIDLGEIKKPTEKETCDYIKDVVSPRLTKALQEHFDASVEIKSIEIASTLPPLEVKVRVCLEQDGVNFSRVVELKETWIY